jgi:hypothetical protein
MSKKIDLNFNPSTMKVKDHMVKGSHDKVFRIQYEKYVDTE